MFGFSKKQPVPPEPSTSLRMRDTLFGDASWEKWQVSDQEPWSSFRLAHQDAQNNQQDSAVSRLRGIINSPRLESRHYLQAWHFLRQLGVSPDPDQAKHVYGIVIEVGMPQGLDLLAAYEDGSARYWNFSGKGIVWEQAIDPDIDRARQELIALGVTVAAKIGPWEGQRPPVPGPGVARLNMLTPSGLHFGQGPMNELMKDPHAGALLNAGAKLMQLLIAKSQQSNKPERH